MGAEKASRPATASVNEPRKIDQLAGQIDFQISAPHQSLQAAKLLRRFAMSRYHAEIVAALAFGEVTA